jgi:hypothetical protein
MTIAELTEALAKYDPKRQILVRDMSENEYSWALDVRCVKPWGNLGVELVLGAGEDNSPENMFGERM